MPIQQEKIVNLRLSERNENLFAIAEREQII